MTATQRLAALARLAAIRKDADLSALAAADGRVRSARAGLAALDAALTEARCTAAEASEAAIFLAIEGFGRWAATRRLALHERLRDAERLATEARSRARSSFGRADVLERLASADRPRPRRED